MRTKLMGAVAALAAALTLVLGVAFPGALPVLQMPTAQAETATIPVSPQTKKYVASSGSGQEPTFTVGADATMTSLDYTFAGPNFPTTYEFKVNGRTLKTQRNPPHSGTINGLNVALKKGDVISMKLSLSQYPEGSVSITPRGTLANSTPPEPTDPETPTDPGSETPSVTAVTPAAPTAVDPAKAPQCVEKGYINIPSTKGVDYFIEGNKSPEGKHVYEGTGPGKVTVTAKAQSGYKIASGAQTSWSFDFSGKVKNCSDGQPTLPNDARQFDAEGHNFSLKGDPVDPSSPDSFTAKVEKDSKLKYLNVRIDTDATFLDWQHYQLKVDQIEDGVTLERRNVNFGNGYITMQAVPVKDGKQVDLATVPAGAVFTFTNNLSENKHLKVKLDVYGEEESTSTEGDISSPDGADWVHKRVANPTLAKRCGLKIAVVADLSRSLQYADGVNGFEKSKEAGNAFIDALAGTSAELGIYNFAGFAPANKKGTTGGPVSMSSQDGVKKAKEAVNNWEFVPGNEATDWQAGLKQVQKDNYDVVYFITDGMPTISSGTRAKGIGGEFVQATALNDAIDAANALKNQGTRVVPIMVDLTVGGKTPERPVVESELVLKDVKRISQTDEVPWDGKPYYRINSGVPEAIVANYINTDTMVNLEMAYNRAAGRAVEVFTRADFRAGKREITRDMSQWTYGSRAVKTMGEDISGTGNTVRVNSYGALSGEMQKIAKELSSLCKGEITVKKRIVDENGKVLKDNVPGWEFTLSAGGNDVIDLGNGEVVRKSLKATSWANGDRGIASWDIKSEQEQELTLTETQKEGFTLYQRGEKNAVCTEARDGKTQPLEVVNDGAFGFKVKMSAQDKKLSSISCVVDNYKAPDTNSGKLTFKKAQYVGDKIEEMPGLGGATFAIYPSKEGKPDFSAKPLHVIKPNQESIEVKKTGTFFLVETKAPQGLNLLAQPVPFEIALDQETKEYKISTVGESGGQIQVGGSGQKMFLLVADTTSGKLPKTGGPGVGLVALVGIALAGAGLMIGRRKTA